MTMIWIEASSVKTMINLGSISGHQEAINVTHLDRGEQREDDGELRQIRRGAVGDLERLREREIAQLDPCPIF